MDIGIIGLGKMGGNMAERLLRAGHRVVGFDANAAAGARVSGLGGVAVDSLEAMVAALPAPRAIWMMVPAGAPVDATIANDVAGKRPPNQPLPM